MAAYAPQVVFILLGLSCLSGWISPPIALAFGLVFALTLGNPFPKATPKATKWLLQGSVVGLGFGLNLHEVWAAGKTGFWFTVATIVCTLGAGWLIGRWLKVERTTSVLVSSGTAICGGSAIAAVGAVLEADTESLSVSLGTVFILNSLALFLFPPIGHALGMNQTQFGLWSAIAIHDTSSVVGAAARFGEEALRVATTVKLTRALWIVPLSIGVSFLSHRRKARITIPWFILLFILAAAVRTFLPGAEPVYGGIKTAAKLGLTLTLFLIGSGLSRAALRTVGIKPLLQGVLLWIVISALGFWAVVHIT